MAYRFKFANNDLFVNPVITYPECIFQIYQGVAYYNNNLGESGSFVTNVNCTPRGYISLYEQNIDRTGSSGMDALPGALPIFEHAVKEGVDPRTLYAAGALNPKTQPFIVKDGTRIGFATVSTTNFNSDSAFGEVMTNEYPLSSSISKEYWSAATPRRLSSVISESAGGGGYEVDSSGSVSHLYSLVNTMNYYQTVSPHYAVSSSIVGGPAGRDLTASAGAGAVNVGLVSIPSIFYGKTIKKGSVDLRYYISGSLVGQLKDSNQNGNLIQVGPPGSTYSGSIAGVVLYTEGFIVLTGSWSLDNAHAELYNGSSDKPRWVYFADSLSGSSALAAMSSSYYLGFKGTEIIPTLTMFAHARKNVLNHSNNTTFTAYTEDSVMNSGALGYQENNQLDIKNVVSSAYNDPTGSFQKITYISQIAIYDENQNVLGVAKLATPVKKTEDRDLTFKLKLDI